MVINVIRDRTDTETIDIYDINWYLMPFVGLNLVACNGLTLVTRPLHWDKMKEICRIYARKMESKYWSNDYD